MRKNVQSKTKMWTALLEALITAIFSASKVDVVKKMVVIFSLIFDKI